MTTHTNFLTLSTQPDAPTHLSGGLSSLCTSIVAWATTCADYYAAAATYEQLSGLSDAELHRRDLSRATLAWDICQALDGTSRPLRTWEKRQCRSTL